MPGPWEKYGGTATAQPAVAGPWAKYAAPEPQEQERDGVIMSNLKGFAKGALETVAWGGEQLDRFVGAPVRAAADVVSRDLQQNAQTGEYDPSRLYRVPLEAGRAAARQLISDPSEAPTGKDIATREGVPLTALSEKVPSLYSETGDGLALKKGGFLDPTAAGAVGLGLDVGLDVSNVIPGKTVVQGVAMAAKGGAKGAKVAARLGGEAAQVAAKGVDAVTGTQLASKTVKAGQKTLEAFEKGAEALSATLKARYGTEVAADFEKSLEVAKRNGIDPELLPEAVVFGPNKVVTRAARVKAEGPLGQPLLEKFEQATEQVRDAIQNDISRIGGTQAPNSAAEAGRLLAIAFDDGVDRTLREASTTYRNALKEIGAETKIPLPPSAKLNLQERLDGVKAYAQDLVENSFDDVSESQGKQLLKAVERMEKVEDYEGLITGLQGIGRTAFKVKNTMASIPPDIGKFRELYGALKEAAVETVEKRAGPQVANRLRESNELLSQLFQDKAILSAIGDAKGSPDKLFRSMVMQGDAARIEALKRYLPKKELQELKGAFLKEMVRQTSNPQGGFTVRMLANQLRGKDDALRALFNPGELDNMRDLLELWDKYGSPVMSSSNTGASNAFQKLQGMLTKPLDLAERGFEEGLSAKAQANKRRVIGIETPATTAKGRPPVSGSGPILGDLGDAAPVMGFRERLGKLNTKLPRSRAARVYSIYDEEEAE